MNQTAYLKRLENNTIEYNEMKWCPVCDRLGVEYGSFTYCPTDRSHVLTTSKAIIAGGIGKQLPNWSKHWRAAFRPNRSTDAAR